MLIRQGIRANCPAVLSRAWAVRVISRAVPWRSELGERNYVEAAVDTVRVE